MSAIYWFRNDLRLYDNPTLTAASQEDDLILLHIFDETDQKPMGSAQRWWLHHSLTALIESLNKKNVHLVLKKGNPQEILNTIIKKYSIRTLYYQKQYEPHSIETEKTIAKDCEKLGVQIQAHTGYLLTEPHQIKNNTGDFFKVYTAYWRKVSELIEYRPLLPIPKKIHQKTMLPSDQLSAWRLLPTQPDWSKGFKIWRPGEKAAQQALADFLASSLKNYQTQRDRPDLPGTARLSPYLHFGELSIQHVWQLVQEIQTKQPSYRESATTFLKQLVWREFSYYLLYHFPHLPYKNFKSDFNRFQWKKSGRTLKAWQQGQTGYPIVDAGLRELWATGYMHNRVRMIVASFLTKDLLIDWRKGEEWFWDTLLDADLANNSASWQWVAGSGVDAAPYFRIFNPTLQSKKFDPDGIYLRQWLPELAALPNAYIHAPTTAPTAVLEKHGITLGTDYPWPIVDHDLMRKEALIRYKNIGRK